MRAIRSKEGDSVATQTEVELTSLTSRLSLIKGDVTYQPVVLYLNGETIDLTLDR